jgi:ATP-dependent Clp protease ATP-binding subunit ClpC
MSDKFDKFTERARNSLILAQQEAKSFHHDHIGPGHLLLGLIREAEGVAGRILQNFNVNLLDVRSKVFEIIGEGNASPDAELGLSPRSKKVIELAVDESRRLNHNYIGTEHILIGINREEEEANPAERIMVRLDITLEEVRSAVIDVVRQTDPNVTNEDLSQFSDDELILRILALSGELGRRRRLLS